MDTNEEVLNFNKGRSVEMLRYKYAAMNQSAFSFYRGTAHLFYQDMPADAPILNAPPVWICGDLHLENFGSYKGDNRVAYFDVNDFDESTLASALLDPARLMTSIYVASDFLRINKQERDQLSKKFLDTYADTLSKGYIRYLEQESSKGIIKDFLKTVALRKLSDFIAGRVENKKDRTKLIIDNKTTMSVPKEIKKQVAAAMEAWGDKTEHPKYYKIKDIAYRIAGTGSLGIERYILLMGGNGKNDNFLLDVKEARPSVVETFLKTPNYPHFDSQAERVIELEKRIQPVPPALLSTINFNKKSFVIRELQPTSDKINLSLLADKIKKLTQLLEPMAQTLAWGQLRSGGRQGSSVADTLIAFGKNKNDWENHVLDFAKNYSEKVKSDYKNYVVAYKQKFFK